MPETLSINDPSGLATHTAGHMPVHRIVLPEPKMGSKCFLIETKGVYILETGPGTLRSIACTHVGTGALTIHDGIPDDRGFFERDALLDPYSPKYLAANGRRIFKMTPQIMGFFATDAGFQHGLTVVADGGAGGIPVFLSIAWVKFKGSTASTKKVEMLKD